MALCVPNGATCSCALPTKIKNSVTESQSATEFFCPQTLLIGEITHAHERTYSAYSYHTVLCECNMHYTTTFRRNLRAPSASVFRLPLRRCPKLRNPCVLHRNRFGSQPVGTHRRPPILTSLTKRNETLVGACSASLGFERCKVVDFL